MSLADFGVWIARTVRQAIWAPLIVLIFWAVAAKGFHAYIRFPWLDIPTHFGGGLAIAYFLSVACRQLEAFLGSIHAVFRLTLAFALTAVAAVFWEFLEFLSDFFLGSHLNLGVTDTLSDLFFGLLGGACTVGLQWGRRHACACGG